MSLTRNLGIDSNVAIRPILVTENTYQMTDPEEKVPSLQKTSFMIHIFYFTPFTFK